MKAVDTFQQTMERYPMAETGAGYMFPAPPVCTAYWDGKSWAKYIGMHGVVCEPQTIPSGFGTWHKTGRTNEKGEALYSLTKENL